MEASAEAAPLARPGGLRTNGLESRRIEEAVMGRGYSRRHIGNSRRSAVDCVIAHVPGTALHIGPSSNVGHVIELHNAATHNGCPGDVEQLVGRDSNVGWNNNDTKTATLNRVARDRRRRVIMDAYRPARVWHTYEIA